MATRTTIFATNDVLDADDLNSLAGAWNSYTPTLVGVTTSSVTGRYLQFGKLVVWRAEATVSAAPTGAVSVSLPAAASSTANGSVMGHARLALAAGTYDGAYIYNTSTTVLVRYWAPSTGLLADLSSSLPAAWASGHTIGLNGIYEAA